jgi:hypothetical protein
VAARWHKRQQLQLQELSAEVETETKLLINKMFRRVVSRIVSRGNLMPTTIRTTAMAAAAPVMHNKILVYVK